jgi:hypothetical protein
MSPAEFEPAIPVGDRSQTHALDRSATGMIMLILHYLILNNKLKILHEVL